MAIVLALVLSMFAAAMPGATQAAVQSNSLKVTPLVSVVPADGLSHAVLVVSLTGSQNKPAIASGPLQVFLSSSNPGVGQVPSSVTIPAVGNYAIVNLTTTTSPGSTTISASAQGENSGSVQVKTGLLSGFPTAIEAYAAPNQQAAQPESNGTVALELVDNYGNPAEATAPTAVTLSSSDTRILNVTGLLSIGSGQVLASATYTTGLLTGSATISISALGLKSTTVTVDVVGSTPTQLKVESVTPSPPDSTLEGTVWLEDQSGNPVVAPADISVSLTSSNFSLVNIPPQFQNVTIYAGTTYAEFMYSTGDVQNPESATITSAVTGLTSYGFTETVEPPSAPTSIHLDFMPSVLLADNESYQSVYVYLTGTGGTPAVAPATLSVDLTSSTPSVATVDSVVDIYQGQSFGVGNTSTTYLVGSTQVTAVAFCNCLNPATGTLTSYGQAPYALEAATTQLNLPANGRSFDDIAVQVMSQQGKPAVAPSDIVINFSSSSPSIVGVKGSAILEKGQDSVLIPIQTSTVPGTASVSIFAQDLTSPQPITVTTTVPGASGTTLTFAPQPGIGLTNDGIGAVQLVDSSGEPVTARADVGITLTASNLSVLASPLNLTVPAGSSYLTFPLVLKSPGTATFTATSQGLLPSSAQVEVESAPFRSVIVAPSSASSGPKQGNPVTLTVVVSLQGEPVQGAEVSWSSSIGSVSPQSEQTGSNGEAQASFVSQTTGKAVVYAQVTYEGGGSFTSSLSLTVSSSSALGFLSNDYLILGLVAAIAVVVAADLYYLRRRRTPKKTILSDLKQA